MPRRPPKPCPQCGALLYDNNICANHERLPATVEARPSASARGYGWDWKTNVRDPYIAANPWCVDPYQLHKGQHIKARIVDHKLPRRLGGTDDWTNLQGLCSKCHQIKGYKDGSRKLSSREGDVKL